MHGTLCMVLWQKPDVWLSISERGSPSQHVLSTPANGFRFSSKCGLVHWHFLTKACMRIYSTVPFRGDLQLPAVETATRRRGGHDTEGKLLVPSASFFLNEIFDSTQRTPRWKRKEVAVLLRVMFQKAEDLREGDWKWLS